MRIIYLLIVSAAYSAEITAVSKSKFLAKLNPSSEFKVGDKVCAFDGTLQIACGVIRKVTDSATFVRFSKKDIALIKKGQTVQAAGPSVVGSGSIKMSEVATKVDHRSNIKGSYHAALTAHKNNEIAYNPLPQDATTRDSLWLKPTTRVSSIIAGSLEVERPIGEDQSYAIGIRYRYLYTDLLTDDYYTDLRSPYVEITRGGNSIGLFFDYYLMQAAWTDWAIFRPSIGLDIEQGSVYAKATLINDTEKVELTKGESKLSTASLTFGGQISMPLAPPLGFTLGLKLLVPLASFGKGVSFSSTDPNAAQLPEGKTAEQDFEEALGHSKSSFGAELVVGSYLIF